MKSRLRLAFASLALVCLSAVPAHPAPGEPPTELGRKMEDLNASWRKLRRQVADPAKNADSLDLVAKIKAASADAATLSPAKTGDLPEAERAKFQADYAAGMKKFAAMLDQLEAALKANHNDEAGKLVTALADFQRESHKLFRRPPPEKAK